MISTNTQVSKLCKALENGSLANTKLSKTQLHKIGQSGGFLGKPLGPLLKTGLSLIANVLKSLAKSILIPLGLTAAAAAVTDAPIYKKMFGSGMTTLITSNEEMSITKIVKSLEESGLLIKELVKQLKTRKKNKKKNFLEFYKVL